MKNRDKLRAVIGPFLLNQLEELLIQAGKGLGPVRGQSANARTFLAWLQRDDEPKTQHVCGLQGYRPGEDPPCPRCVELGR